MYTIKKRKDFINIQQNYDKRFHGKSIIIIYKKNNLEIVRCGYIITKKINKKAVVRNKIKRQLREIARLSFKDGIFKRNYDYEFIVKKEFLDISFLDIKKEIYNLLNN